MYMEDEKGIDSKVVLSPHRRRMGARSRVDRRRSQEIGGYFRKYKRWEAGKFSKVPGWGSVAEGRAHVTTTHAFFRDCRMRAGATCQVKPAR